MTIWARKTNYRTIQTNSVPAGDLSPIRAIRKTSNRSTGQYKVVCEDGSEVQMQNFKELKFYNNLVLRNRHKHMTIEKQNGIASTRVYSYPPGSCS